MRVINIEIKSEKFYEDLKILDSLALFIERADISSKCIVSSFNPYLLYKLKKKYPNIIQGFLYSGHKPVVCNLFWMLLCRPDNLHINYRAINPFIRWWAKRKGLYINVYTVNDCDTYHLLQQAQTDGIFSDNIEYLK
jgi:glycerophosphoryl diester phosphodiesterase